MNNEVNNPDSLDELSADLRAAVERMKRRPVPEVAMQMALGRVSCGNRQLQWASRRSRRNYLLGFAAAIVACVALGIWFSRPSDLWAEVAQAINAKPWIHATSQGAEPGENREFWISTSQATGGSLSKEQITFFDDRLQIVYRYEPQKGLLYRLPASDPGMAEGQRFLELFQGLFRGDRELKAAFPGMIQKDRQRGQVEKDGRRWDEYEFRFQIPTRPDADIRMTFLVDTQTRLPHAMTMKQEVKSIAFKFDYPDNGPADIYALGVPKDAKLIDRVPTGDMTRILAGIKVGRERFDDFHAIVAEHGGSKDSLVGNVYIAWKNGKRWRVELGRLFERDSVEPDDKNAKEWLLKACKKTTFTTLDVCDGSSVYRADLSRDQRTRGQFKLHATPDQAYSMCPQAMRAMPVTWCYPITLPEPNDRTEEVVNAKPSEGPPSTILVTSSLLDFRSHDPANTYAFQRFWLDPLRGYGVARNDTMFADPAVKPPTDRDIQTLMDKWDQTPSGIWYAKRVRTGSFVNEQKAGATWYHFFLDFKSEMPDDIFKPAKRSVLTERYPVGN